MASVSLQANHFSSKRLKCEHSGDFLLFKQDLFGIVQSFFNFKDFIAAKGVCKRWNVLLLPNLCLKIDRRIQELLDLKGKNFLIPQNWKTPFNQALPKIKTLKVQSFLDHKFVIKILQQTSVLTNLDMNLDSTLYMFQLVNLLSLLPLKELTCDPVFWPCQNFWKHKTLTKLDISYTVGFFYYTELSQPLPKLKILTLKNCISQVSNGRNILLKLKSLNTLYIERPAFFAEQLVTEEVANALTSLEKLKISNPSNEELASLSKFQSLKELTIDLQLDITREAEQSLLALVSSNSFLRMNCIVGDFIDLNNRKAGSDYQTILEKEKVFSHVFIITNLSEIISYNDLKVKMNKFKLTIKDFRLNDNNAKLFNAAIDVLSKIKELHEIELFLDEEFGLYSEQESCFINFLDKLGHKITAINAGEQFIFLPNILKQLNKKPLQNCKNLKGFFYEETILGEKIFIPTKGMSRYFPNCEEIR